MEMYQEEILGQYIFVQKQGRKEKYWKMLHLYFILNHLILS